MNESPIGEELLKKVDAYLDMHLQIDRSRTVIVGLSGGGDSVALLDILHRLGMQCLAAHCNFQLRGEESLRDSLFARQTATAMQVPFYEISFETGAYAARRNISIEMACRELRYEWFEKIRREQEAAYIAVAHHSDDSVETFFLNLIRGTGVAGLVGIRPVNGRIIRPLLCTDRSGILNYLNERSLRYVTDSSNLEEVYLRNKIRLALLPLLHSIQPAVSESVLRTIGNLQEVEKVYDRSIGEALRKMVRVDGNIRYMNIRRLLEQASPLSCLYEWLNPFGFASSVCREILRSMQTPGSGKRFYASGYRVIRDREELILGDDPAGEGEQVYYIEAGVENPDIPVPLSVREISHCTGFVVPKSPYYACFDAEKISFPLLLRKWRQGDRFKPFGMKGYKKLSDYFSDHKYTLLQKEEAWVLCSGDEIIWLVGQRSSDVARVQDDTRKIVLMQCK